VWITYNNNRTDACSVRVDKGLLEAYLKAFDVLKSEYNIPDDVSTTSVARLPDVLVVEEPDDDIEAISDLARKAAQAAVNEVIAMRQSEGERLKADLIKYVQTIAEALESIKQKAPQVVTEYSQKLKKSITELLDGAVPDETRFDQEVAYFADRCSIEEETVRLSGHIEHVIQTLESSQPVGRKLDFLIQEMNREANTIGSKASDMEIINNVVLIKGEIEKLREQVQNIE
ncbi:MAG TPA: YicC family protein, partial [Clostridia bacterium]|nr:YicC family protein [Clostridia bacterium]